VVTAAASALLVAAVLRGSTANRARPGTVALMTDQPDLTAEVLDARGEEVVVPRFPVPTSQPVSLAEGPYQVRLSASGLLSDAYDLHVDPGTARSYRVGLGRRRLWPPIPIQQADARPGDGRPECPWVWQPVPFQQADDPANADRAGRTDVIQVADEAVRRIDGATGRPVWEWSTTRRAPTTRAQPTSMATASPT
jgi:hypothetical protein